MLKIGMRQALLTKIAPSEEEGGDMWRLDRVFVESGDLAVAGDERRLMVVGTPPIDPHPYPDWSKVVPDLDEGYTCVGVDAQLLGEMLALIPDSGEGRPVCVLAAPQKPRRPIVIAASPHADYPCMGLLMPVEIGAAGSDPWLSQAERLREAVQAAMEWARQSDDTPAAE